MPSPTTSIFKKYKVEPGDEIEITSGSDKWTGTLMPGSANGKTIVLKLSNGYNIGISTAKAKIRLIKKFQRRADVKHAGASRGEVAVIGCGGTIASKVEYKTGAVYPAITPEELMASFPKLAEVGRIHTRKLFTIFSEDMGTWHWSEMANACLQEIKEGVTGIVLMHGTDTIAYSSAALSFMLQNLPVPIIFVGSQRSSDRPSSDNEFNLLNSVYAAKQNFAEVAICMHANSDDDYAYLHRGTRVRKMHTSKRDAFRTINEKPIATVDYSSGKFEAGSTIRKRNSEGKIQAKTRVNPNVAMVYAYPGLKPEMLKAIEKEADGVVLVGTGLGHVSTNPFGDKHAKGILQTVESWIASGIPVAMSPQTIGGRINLNVYTTGRLLKEAGVIGDEADWLPETCYTKLAWVLGQTKDMKKVKELMEMNMVGEITTRSALG